MKTTQLKDDWHISGKDFEGFKQALNDIAASTYVAEVNTSDLSLLHCTGVTEDKLRLIIHSKKYLDATNNKAVTYLPVKTLEDNEVTEDFLNEIEKETKLFVRLAGAGNQNEDLYMTSYTLMRDLGARASLGGDAIYEPTGERDAYFISRFVRHPQQAFAVIRANTTDNGAMHKVFALPSSSYCPIDQRILLDMLETLVADMGNYECQRWYIDHNITQIMVTFPEAAKDMCEVHGLPDKYVPGVILETSDTCTCALRAVAVWVKKSDEEHYAPNGAARIDEYSRQHRGNIETQNLLTTMSSTLMSKYIEVPRRLAELLTIDVNPNGAIEKIFKVLHADKVLGKKRAIELQEAMLNDPTLRPISTAYDLAVIMMEAASRYISNKAFVEPMELLAGKALKLDYQKLFEHSEPAFLKAV